MFEKKNSLGMNCKGIKWDLYNNGSNLLFLLRKLSGSLKYLWFVLSTMVNINKMKNKPIWIIWKIFTNLDGLRLKKYYFECAIIFLNVMLRSSILYACETYYNLKETEIRQIERIEEGFLRKVSKTSTGCPISQLYLELVDTPCKMWN